MLIPRISPSGDVSSRQYLGHFGYAGCLVLCLPWYRLAFSSDLNSWPGLVGLANVIDHGKIEIGDNRSGGTEPKAP